MSDLVQIDGSYGEGGGQVLRTSLSLSAITGKPVEIVNIRAGRAKPGLRSQHLASVRAAAQICGAKLKGDAVGSGYLFFEPTHEVVPAEYQFDIGTAGATTLVAQTLIVPLSLAGSPSRVIIRGGTHNPMAPTADYLQHVYCRALRVHGYNLSSAYDPPGFNPGGGGILQLEIGPATERSPFALSSHIEPVWTSYVVTSQLPPAVAERGAEALRELRGTVVKRVEQGFSAGAAVTITTPGGGFSALGERGKPMERVAAEAVLAACDWYGSQSAVDEHLADQLVLPALYASGCSIWRTGRVTEHLRTVLWVAGCFCSFEFGLDESSGEVFVEPTRSTPLPPPHFPAQ